MSSSPPKVCCLGCCVATETAQSVLARGHEKGVVDSLESVEEDKSKSNLKVTSSSGGNNLSEFRSHIVLNKGIYLFVQYSA